MKHLESTIQVPLPLSFSVASAHDDSRKVRFHPMFDGRNWSCDCKHYEEYHTHCRHILEKRLETKTTGLFNGDSYEPLLDEIRLTKQSLRIFRLMVDGEWRTLSEINEETQSEQNPKGDPPASVSAQLRHFRKKRFGSHLVDKRRRGDDTGGLWEYRLVMNEKSRMVLG
jgi:hypothetical protein